MSDETKTLTVESAFTLETLMKEVPRRWRKVTIAVGDETYDRCYAVRRVALHSNANGSGVIIIYTDPAKRVRK